VGAPGGGRAPRVGKGPAHGARSGRGGLRRRRGYGARWVRSGAGVGAARGPRAGRGDGWGVGGARLARWRGGRPRAGCTKRNESDRAAGAGAYGCRRATPRFPPGPPAAPAAGRPHCSAGRRAGIRAASWPRRLALCAPGWRGVAGQSARLAGPRTIFPEAHARACPLPGLRPRGSRGPLPEYAARAKPAGPAAGAACGPRRPARASAPAAASDCRSVSESRSAATRHPRRLPASPLPRPPRGLVYRNRVPSVCTAAASQAEPLHAPLAVLPPHRRDLFWG
jgi:hypothetical protein